MNNILRKVLKALFWYLMFDAMIMGYAGFLPGVDSAAAQTIIPKTTLSAAVSSTSTTNITVTSTTGMTAGTTMLYVDGEAMFVNAVFSSTNLQVGRGYNSTRATTHLSGALVWNAPPFAFQFSNPSGYPSGSCTRANQLYLPFIDVNNAVISDCLGGVWVNGDTWPAAVTAFRVLAPNPGAVAYTGLGVGGVGTTLAATTMYCTEIDLPFNKLLTGIGILNGATVGTDNHLVALYDASGNLLANSATAGVLAAGASAYQNISFTSTFFAVGPATYFGCMQTNGTTALVRMLPAGIQDNYLTKGVTGQTFGTIPATITVPTTFTTAVGPYLYVF